MIHPAIKSTPVVCGVCGLPIHESETDIRHFGFYIAHSQNRCIYLLRAKVDEEKKWAGYRGDVTLISNPSQIRYAERLEYIQGVLSKIWSILADGQRALDPDADPEYDTNNLYDLVREGVEAKKKLAEGKREIAKFLDGRIEEAGVELDVTLKAASDAVESCAKTAEVYDDRVCCDGNCGTRIAELIRCGERSEPHSTTGTTDTSA